jgi:hypothetical protein
MTTTNAAVPSVQSPPGKGEFRILPDKHHVEVEGGGVWSTPHDGVDDNLEWRLRYANPEQLVKDRFKAAGVVECYRELIWCSEKRRRQVIRSLRAAYKEGAK